MNVTALTLLAVAIGGLLAGCGHVDTTPAGSAERVLTGTVTARMSGELPRNTEIVVRVVDVSRGVGNADILGEDTVVDPRRLPVSFRIEYRADDALLRRSAAVEARVSVEGRLRMVTKSAHPLTLSNANGPFVLEVEPVGKQSEP